ncbi:30S ribosomal protein S14 [Hyphobacterium sp. HN65]|uniref:Small ribosomal subunit protein uS14 n=1 Tax=Hyphobacterium lacteum TaxID=3116575 RepID=A0ABU7LMP7_9PROT|nr:30S ribosomal protein S14 [Hyphobacterium sp. HN65]MEE2525203.1 30S ribosomal protein S14 [Hyphobacterium sp. HN65]
MAKTSAVERNRKRQKMAERYAAKRAELKTIARDQSKPVEERFAAQLKLAQLPRNSAPTRIRNRCEVTGRPRGFYRKLKMSRIALRELASSGFIPGMVKSSW